jgi:hypothetical protein
LELSLFQWIGLGLGIAIILIPIVRWFWKRFDMPSKRAVEIMQRQEKEQHEAEMWAGIEAQVEAETSAKRESEMKQREKQERGGKTLDEVESVDVWNKLGIDVPIKPVDREIAPPVTLEKTPSDEETDDESLAEPGDEAEQAEAPDEPDWELIDKMANLSEPMEGVPDAPDLQELVIEEPPKSVEIEPQVLMQKEEFVNDEPDWPVKW